MANIVNNVKAVTVCVLVLVIICDTDCQPWHGFPYSPSPAVQKNYSTQPTIESISKLILDKTSHYGKHFVLGFTAQHPGFYDVGYLKISVVAMLDTNVTIKSAISNSILFERFVKGGQIEHFKLNITLRMTGTNIQRKGVEVKSTKEIAVFCLNYVDVSADGYLALPVSALGNVYAIATYEPYRRDQANVGIISANPGTSIRVEFKGSGNILYRGMIYGKNRSLIITLEELEAFHISQSFDLSGMIITANKPVSVISGNTCPDYRGRYVCGYTSTFLLPVRNWGKDFVVTHVASWSDLFRVFAYENNTTVRSSSKEIVLSSGEYTEISLIRDKAATFINCTKPCQVVQYVTDYVKPAMIYIPSINQFRSTYTVVLQNDGSPENKITFFILEKYKKGLTMNGFALTRLQWKKIKGTEYTWAEKSISGTDTAVVCHSTKEVTFGLVVIGWKRRFIRMAASYGYPGGFQFTKSSVGAQLTTTLTKATQRTSPSTIATTTIRPSTNSGSCPKETNSTAWGIFSWPKTTAGARSTVSCPHDSKTFVTRECQLKDALWKHFNASFCPYLNKTSLEIFRLSQIPVNSSNVLEVCKQIRNLSFPGKKLIPEDVANMASVLEKVAAVDENTSEVADDIFNTVDNILDASSNTVAESQRATNSSARILHLLDRVLEAINIPERESFKRTLRNFAVDLSAVNPRSFSGVTCSGILANNKSQVLLEKNFGKNNEIASQPKATSIYLPETLFNESISLTLAKPRTVICALYKKVNLFLVSSEDSSYRLNSYVIAGRIKSLSLSNLRNPVILTFTRLQNGKENSTSCVFWSFRLARWSDEGCTFKGVQKDGRIVCNCNHLTNFAMLMDTNTDDETSDEKVLGIISYIGCILSLIGLILTITTIFLFKDLRGKVPFQILLNFCMALSLTLVVFLSAAERSKTSSLTSCRVVAIALHYLVLVVFMWMATEAFNMYRNFVKVLPSPYSSRFIQKCCLVAWGSPALIVSVTAGVAFENYGDKKYCRLHGLPFLVSFLTPVLIILFFNAIAFVFIFHSLLTSGSKLTSDRKVTGYQHARQGFAILVVLGLTWLFGVLAINEAKEIFQYLFCIFNSVQGLLVFVFYCILPARSRKRYQDFMKKKSKTRSENRAPLFGESDFQKSEVQKGRLLQHTMDTSNRNTIPLSTSSRSSSELQSLTRSPRTQTEMLSFQSK